MKDCLEQGYLTELLTNYRREVMGMLLYEYDEKKHLRNTYEEGRREGVIKGRQKKSYESARNMYRRAFLSATQRRFWRRRRRPWPHGIKSGKSGDGNRPGQISRRQMTMLPAYCISIFDSV